MNFRNNGVKPTGLRSRIGVLALTGCCILPAPYARAGEPGALLLQVEDCAGPWRSQTNIPGYLGTGFKTSNAAGVAETAMRGKVTVPRAGCYAVWARGYEGGGSDRSFFVSVNALDLRPTHISREAQGFSWQRAGEVELTPGEAEDVIHDHGDSFEVADAVLLTDDLQYDPARAEQARRVLPDGAAENRRLVDTLIAQTVNEAEAGHARWAQAMERRETWEPARQELQRRFQATVGLEPLPARTPLNARILGETPRDGYKVQRLLFESRPGFVVTANVYVPLPADRETRAPVAARFPAVLCPPGHWQFAKAQEQVQARCIGLAKLGFLALSYDPFGQGERNVEGNGHQEYFRTVLAGRNNMSYMLWDTMRALDYLLTRDDVDPDRIACTGASGGGLNTLYVAALDERLKVAIPVVYTTSFREFLGTRLDHCPCSHLPGLAGYADMGDLAALIAPRPLLLLAAQQDPMFTVRGAQEALAEALPAYRAYGCEEHVQLREFSCGHDYNQPMREALYGFVRKHLNGEGDGAPTAEPALTLEPVDSPALRCFDAGHVPSTAATVRSLARQDALALREQLPPAEGADRAALRKVLAWPTGALPTAMAEPVSGGTRPGVPEKILLRAADGVALPGLLLPAGPEAPTAVCLDENGAQNALDTAPTAALRGAGWNVVALDLRGWGETRGREHLLATDSLLWGRPLVTQRALDLLAAVTHLRTRGDLAQPMVLLAKGPSAGMVSLVASALGGGFAAVAVDGLPESLLDLFDSGVPAGCAVWNLLTAADVPHLKALSRCPVRVPFGPVRDLVAWARQAAEAQR